MLKTRWKSLRDNFRIEFKRIPRDSAGNCLISPNLHKSKWAYYKSLLFLVDHMKSRYPTQEYIAQETNLPNTFVRDLQSVKPDNSSSMDFSGADDTEDIDYIQIPDVPPPLSMSPSISPNSELQNGQTSPALPPLVPVTAPKNYPPAKRLRVNEDGEKTNSSNGKTDDKLDDDYHFLMSLHTYMGQLKNSQRLKIRMKIQELLYSELFGNEDDKTDN